MSYFRDPKDTSPEEELEQPGGEGGTAPERSGEAGEGGRSADPRREADPLARLEAEREEMRQMLIRRQADFENFRKRVERERREDRERAIASLGDSLLPVLDNFERALAAHQDPAYEDYRRGFEMIYRQLLELLASAGITRMESSVGKRFDPHLHHAIERVESAEHPEGTIVDELQPGFKFRDRVLRPAQVRVAVRPGSRAASPVN